MRAGPGKPYDTEPDARPAAAARDGRRRHRGRRRRERAVARPVEPADHFLQEPGARVQAVRVGGERDRGQAAHSQPAGGPRQVLLHDRQSPPAKPQLRHRWRNGRRRRSVRRRRRRPVDVLHGPADQPGDERAPADGLQGCGDRRVPEQRRDRM